MSCYSKTAEEKEEEVDSATGRLSPREPNLQNIPIRTAVGRSIRADCAIIRIDYTQAELRMRTHWLKKLRNE